MKVKIDNQWYDSDQEAICIQVSEYEQKKIGSMDRSVATNGKFAVFPGNWSRERMLKWLTESGEETGPSHE